MATKMFIPRVRADVVVRPRLLQRLSRSTAKLVLVSAPPGFGKSTLVAEWARTAAAGTDRVAWYSLDASDNDASTFWRYLITTLAAKVPGLARSLALAQGAPIELLVTGLVNELATAADDVWLVLDDYQVIDAPQIRDGLELLIEHLPPQAHIVLTTRVDPPLPLSRWRVRGEVTEVRAAELRFSDGEAAEFLRSAAAVELTAAQVTALTERTEGWIAALQLAALSVRDHQDAGGFIERFAGDDRYIVDYLMDEVLAHQTGAVREFLMLTAPLDRLSGDLCDAVTGLENSARTLAALERANVFVIPLDDHGTWFRYHHLLADVLRARLLSERPELIPLLHRRASTWYEAAGALDDAIRHALVGRDFDRAGHLIQVALPEARRNRLDVVLTRWLQALPEEVARRSPVLTVFRGWTLIAEGDPAQVEAWLDHAEAVLQSVPPGNPQPWPDTVELRTLPATIATYRAALAQAKGDLAGVTRHAQHALEVIAPDDHMARGGAAGFLALAAWSEGAIEPAVQTFTGALASLHLAGNVVDELSGTALLAEMWAVAGRPSKARDLCRSALAEAEPLGLLGARATADLHVRLAELDLEAESLDSAERHLDIAAPLLELTPTSESRHRWFVAAGELAASRGDRARALGLLDRAEELYQPGYYPNIRPIPSVRARVLIRAGDLERAGTWAAESGVTLLDEARYLREHEHLTLVRLALAQRPERTGELDRVIALLHRLDVAAEAAGRAGSLPDIRRQLAIAERSGRPDAGRSAPAPSSQPWSEPLSVREWEVLRLLASELSGPEIAQRLFISHNTLRTHTKHIFAKLEVTSRRAAVARAGERGLLP